MLKTQALPSEIKTESNLKGYGASYRSKKWQSFTKYLRQTLQPWMSYQILLSPQVKESVIISNKYGI